MMIINKGGNEMRIRTKDNYPKYLKAYYPISNATEYVWTNPDTNTWTGEDEAQEFNEIEAKSICKELEALGTKVEII